jgi:hypothetical protein
MSRSGPTTERRDLTTVPGTSAYENIGAMMLEIGAALIAKRASPRSLYLMKPELLSVGVRELRREKRAAVVLEADQATIKQEINMGR